MHIYVPADTSHCSQTKPAVGSVDFRLDCYLYNLVICWVFITVSEADHNTLRTGVGLFDCSDL